MDLIKMREMDRKGGDLIQNWETNINSDQE